MDLEGAQEPALCSMNGAFWATWQLFFFRNEWVVWDALHIAKMFIEMLNCLVDFFLIFSVSLQHLGNYSILLLVF